MSTWELDRYDHISRVRPPAMRVRSTACALSLVEGGAEAPGDGKTLSGTFSTFGTWQEIRESGMTFLERIQPGAFAKTIRERGDQVRVMFSHGKDPSIGSQLLGVVRDLSEDERGAHYEVDLFDGLPELLLQGLRSGAYGSSFRARAIQESFNPRPGKSDWNRRGLPESTLKELALLEIGPTPLPAYPATSARVRGLDRLTGTAGASVARRMPGWFLEAGLPAWQLERRT